MASITKTKTGKGEVRWRLKWRDSTGRQTVRVFRRKVDAEFYRDRRVVERMSGRERDYQAGRQTVGEAFEELLASKEYAPKTVTGYRDAWDRYLRQDLERVPVAEVSEAAVARVLGKIKAPAMRGRAETVLSATFRRAVDHGRIAANPARRQSPDNTRAARVGRKNGKRHRRLTPDDLRRLLTEVPNRYRALTILLATVGLRPGEAFGLRVADVGTVLTVERSVDGPTKSGQVRDVPLPRSIHHALADHIAKYSDPTDPDALVFTAEGGGSLGRHAGYRHALARACRRAAIDPVRPHDLRHTAAALAIDKGANPYHVQRMLGHASASMTLDTYGYMWDESMKELAERLDESVAATLAH